MRTDLYAPPPSLATTVIASSPSGSTSSVIRTAQVPGRAVTVEVVGGPVSNRPPGARVTARTDTVYGAAQGSPTTAASDVPVVARLAVTPRAEVQLTS